MIFHFLQIILIYNSDLWGYTHLPTQREHSEAHVYARLTNNFTLTFICRLHQWLPDYSFLVINNSVSDYITFAICHLLLHSKCHYCDHPLIFPAFFDIYSIFYLALPAFLTKVIYPSIRLLLKRKILYH
jgi:hypothetical protein